MNAAASNMNPPSKLNPAKQNPGPPPKAKHVSPLEQSESAEQTVMTPPPSGTGMSLHELLVLHIAVSEPPEPTPQQALPPQSLGWVQA
jgi:hypothetical protein